MRVCALGSDNWLGTHDCDVLPEVTENCHNWYLKHALLLSLSLSLSLYPSRTDTAEWRKNSSVNSLSPSFFPLSSSFFLFSLLIVLIYHSCSSSTIFYTHSLSFPHSTALALPPSLVLSWMSPLLVVAAGFAHTPLAGFGVGGGGGNVGLWGEIMQARRGRRDISRSPFFFCRLLSCNSGLCPSQQLKQKCLWTWEHWIIAPDYFFHPAQLS